jgi:hypothetical protein
VSSIASRIFVAPVGEGPAKSRKMIDQEVSTITKVVESAGLKPK